MVNPNALNCVVEPDPKAVPTPTPAEKFEMTTSWLNAGALATAKALRAPPIVRVLFIFVLRGISLGPAETLPRGATAATLSQPAPRRNPHLRRKSPVPPRS